MGVGWGFELSGGTIFVRRAASTAVRGYFGIRPLGRPHAFSDILFVIILLLCKNPKYPNDYDSIDPEKVRSPCSSGAAYRFCPTRRSVNTAGGDISVRGAATIGIFEI